MKKSCTFKPPLLLVLVVPLFLSGCLDKAASDLVAKDIQITQSQELKTTTHSDGAFSFSVPDWPDAANAPGLILTKSNLECAFSAASIPAPIELVKKNFKQVQQNKNMTENEDYLEYEISATASLSFKAMSRLEYCDYKTYVLTISCLKDIKYKELLESSSCKKRDLKPIEKLGLVANPVNDDPAQIPSAFKEARENGAQLLYWYFSWKDLEEKPDTVPFVMQPMSYEGKTGVVIEVIHTNVLAPYPAPWVSFDEQGFAERFSDFAAEFAEKYEPDYLFVGNEVDDYLYLHRDKIGAFKNVLELSRSKIKQASPGTKVGFTATYHDAVAHDALDIIQELAGKADIIGYTAYGYSGQFRFEDPGKGIELLEGIPSVVPQKPFAIVEAGWNTSSLLGSSEEKQKQYAEKFFDYLKTTDAEFVNWFSLHDGKDCTQAAQSFLTGTSEPMAQDELFVDSFLAFLCNLGVKKSDGTPKVAWGTWLEQSSNLE